MNLWELILILGTLAGSAAAFIWLVFRLENNQPGHSAKHKGLKEEDYAEAARRDVEHIFNDEFRQELRNRGRLHFEKIINENAMFLQQDLRLTTSQLNEFMKQQITQTLKEEFSKYEQSITDAKQLAIESINKTQTAIEQQRKLLEEQLTKEVATEKSRIMGRFEKNMADIVNHYIVAAIGNQIDLSDQLDYIIGDLENNKKDILEDINAGG